LNIGRETDTVVHLTQLHGHHDSLPVRVLLKETLEWLDNEKYPDMFAALNCNQVRGLHALWDSDPWVHLLQVWPLVMRRLWPVFLFTLPSENASTSDIQIQLASDAIGKDLLKQVFGSARDIYGLSSVALYIRNSLSPRLVSASEQCQSNDTDVIPYFVSIPNDAIFVSDSTRGLVQQHARLPIAFEALDGVPNKLIDLLTDHQSESSTASDSDWCDTTMLDVGGRKMHLKSWRHIVLDPEVDVCVFTLSLDLYALPGALDFTRDRWQMALFIFESTFGKDSGSSMHRLTSAPLSDDYQPPFSLIIALTHADMFMARHTLMPFHRSASPALIASLTPAEIELFENKESSAHELIQTIEAVLRRWMQPRVGTILVFFLF
jgi:hypothetical protein